MRTGFCWVEGWIIKMRIADFFFRLFNYITRKHVSILSCEVIILKQRPRDCWFVMSVSALSVPVSWKLKKEKRKMHRSFIVVFLSNLGNHHRIWPVVVVRLRAEAVRRPEPQPSPKNWELDACLQPQTVIGANRFPLSVSTEQRRVSDFARPTGKRESFWVQFCSFYR